MDRRRKKCDATNTKSAGSREKLKRKEPDSLDDLIAKLPVLPLHSSNSIEDFRNVPLKSVKNVTAFPEKPNISLESKRALVEKIAALEAANEKLVEKKRALADRKDRNKVIYTDHMEEQKKIIKTNDWKIGSLERQLKWQREENLRIISEHRQNNAKTLEKQEQMRNSHAEQLKAIKNESDKKYNDLLSAHRNEICNHQAVKKKLIEEKSALINEKYATELLLTDQKTQRKQETSSSLMAEKERIIKTNNSKIENLEKQLKLQMDESTRIVKKLQTEKKMMQEEMKKVEKTLNFKLEVEKSTVDMCEAERLKMLKEKVEMGERLKFQINEKHRLITEHRQKEAKTLEKQEQMKNSHAEQFKAIKSESDKKYNDLLSVHRNETSAFEATKNRLIGEKHALIDEKSAIETLLQDLKIQRKEQESNLVAEKERIIETNNSRIENLKEQLKFQMDENSRIVKELQMEKIMMQEEMTKLKDELQSEKDEIERIISANAENTPFFLDEHKLEMEEKDKQIESLKSEVARVRNKWLWYFVCTPFRWFWSIPPEYKFLVLFPFLYWKFCR